MDKDIVFRKIANTAEEILSQLRQHKLFYMLLGFFNKDNITFLMSSLRQGQPQKYTVAELKKMLAYNTEQDARLVSDAELMFITNMLKENDKIVLPLAYLVKLKKKTFSKMLRLNKFYGQARYLVQKFSSEKVLKSEEFFLPFLQMPALLALLAILPDEKEISVVVLDGFDELINLKAMQAINLKIKENPAIQPSSATLIMSEACNLRCVYCYEPQAKRNNDVLSFEKAKQVLRKFDRDSKIMFFGGEPMLHVDLMKKICEWGWEYRNFTFQMTTNGQIIDREFFREYAKHFTYVQLSIDGPEPAQEINRGHGSFRRAMEFYNAFKEETGRPPVLFPVLSKYSVPYLLDIVRWFYDVEIRDTQEKLSLRWLPGDASSWSEEDFAVYAEQLTLVKKWYLENNIRNSGFVIAAFAQAEKALLGLENTEVHTSKPSRGEDNFCSAGRALMAVLPSGNMVPCHHEYWCAPQERVYEEVGLDDDSPGVNHMSELCMNDIPECNSCPQWGCCVCPGSFYFHSKSYTVPDKNWCRAGKMMIETAKNYVEELAERMQNNDHKISYLAAGVDLLLQKELKERETHGLCE